MLSETSSPNGDGLPRPQAGKKLATLAAAGLVAGLVACSGAQPNEVVVEPTLPLNTASSDSGPTASAAATAETVDVDQLAPRKKKKPPSAGIAGHASNCCKGMNECKGKGNCKTDDNDCAGKNDCKGLGGCRGNDCDADTMYAPAKDCCKGKNDCKGLGGCKTDRHACKGQNDCKGLGGCKFC